MSLDERTCTRAVAQGGHLEVMQWARLQGCPWNEETSAQCCSGWPHMEVLQWAIPHWDERERWFVQLP